MPDVPEIEDQGTKPATMCQLPSSSPTGPSAPRERERAGNVGLATDGPEWREGNSLEVNSSQAAVLFHRGRNPSISCRDSPSAEKAK